MSIGTIAPIKTLADVEALPKPELKLVARAALAAGYTVDVRHIRYEHMIFANGKHFHPLTNWMQCVRLVVDTGSEFTIGEGYVSIYSPGSGGPDGPPVDELRTPSTDQEYYVQMCEAVVTNVAKGCAF